MSKQNPILHVADQRTQASRMAARDGFASAPLLDCNLSQQALAPHEASTLSPTLHKRGPYSAARSHPCGLTRKEAEVLALLVEGASNLDIASKLKRSRRTIEHHVSAILTKMGVETRMAAVLLSLKQAPLPSRTKPKLGEA
jgi:DNA-binding NarL/FixJ family response regulator